MKKMKDFITNKKYLPFLIGGVLLIITISAVIILILRANNRVKEETTLKLYLEEMGREFYEQKYQPYTEETVLSKFTEVGIKFDLRSLSRINPEQNAKKIESFVNSKTKEECDKDESMVIIYPQSPYGEKDYRVEVVLVCGFDKK